MKAGFIQLSVMSLAMATTLSGQGTSVWVFFGPDHRLQYAMDGRGNRIIDFSYAGYRAGGMAIPDVPVQVRIYPVDGDNTANIQAAIDKVSQLAPDSSGFRGAVLLAPGEYDVAGTLTITTSGVVLRGSGSQPDGTIINMTGDPHRFLEMRGSGTWQMLGRSALITDSYVPSGTNSFHVDDATGFSIGDTVLINRPVTAAWVHFMGMDTLVRNGQPQTWLAVGSSIRTDRVIQSISGNTITLDVPLTDSFDSQLLNPPGASMAKYSFPGRISQVGVERLSIVAPPLDVDISMPQYTVLQMDAVIDAWARDINVQDSQNSVSIGAATKRVTVDGISINHTVGHTGSAAPADFSISGTQILLKNCSSIGSGSWPVVTQARATGPNAILNFYSNQRGASPHQRWATGLLVENCQFPNSTSSTPGVAFSNRGTAGSGHGWDVGWAVAWNVMSPFLLVQEPPGAHNWCIGCDGSILTRSMPGGDGTPLPNGIYDSLGNPVLPASLYLEQLLERLGTVGLMNIGSGDYSSVDGASPFTHPLLVNTRRNGSATLGQEANAVGR